MPREVHKITNFDKGLNSNSNPSSIGEDELSSANNVELSSKGIVKVPGKMVGSVETTSLTTSGIGENGSILGWSSDYSMDTDILYCPEALNTSVLLGTWLSNHATIGSATGLGRVVLVKDSVSYNSGTYDAVYVTRERLGTTNSTWTATDTMYYAADDATDGTSTSQTVTAVEPGPGVPESNKWLIHLDRSAALSVYNYNSSRWFEGIFDMGSGSSVNGNMGISDQVLRIADTTFDKDFVTESKSFWYGYVNRNMFQYDNALNGYYQEGRWVSAFSDLQSWGDIGVTVSMFDAQVQNPGDTPLGSAAGDKILIAYWSAKDSSGLDAYVGEWTGAFEFASAPIYDGTQVGEIDELGTTLTLSGHTLNIQIYVALGTTDPEGLASKINKWPGFGSTDNKRVTGIEIYFRAFGSDDWFILQKVDFVKGDKVSKWKSLDVATETTHGFHAGSFVFAMDLSGTNDNAYQVTQSALTATFTFTVTDGWSGRSGFVRAAGWHYDPVYVVVPDMATASGNATNVAVTNPDVGTYTQWCELLDEDYQLITITATASNEYVDGGNGQPPPHHGGGHCNVAMELWGLNDVRTRQARFYVIANNNWFTRLYKRYGVAWGNIVKDRNWLKILVSPIWKYMSNKGKEYFNNPTGHPKTTEAIRKLKKKYPGQFKYYLIGDNARNETYTHYYDINIVPQNDNRETINPDMWEDVLRTLYYIKENDERYANPNICPQFYDVRGYNGEEVYAHRDDIHDCYFYYDKTEPKDVILENTLNTPEEFNHIKGNLYHNKLPLILEKWRVRGLDKIPYRNKEII